MTVTIIGVTQARRTAGTEAINGVLPIKGFASASEKVAWYGKR